MTEIEQIFPYTIVSDGKGYGIVDAKGNIVVPCEMDDIVNANYEDTGLELWTDYCCVFVVKNGMVGFFTDNGKFIEPVYHNYTVDPCGGDIYVETEDGFGVFRSPEYVFEEIDEEESLLVGNYEDFEYEDIEDIDENHFYGGDETDPAALREAGYKIAESIWNEEYANVDGEIDFGQFYLDVEDAIFDELSDCRASSGAAEFITSKCIGYVDMPSFNNAIKKLCNDSHKDGYYSLFRTIDRLLPHPEDTDEFVVRFSKGNRPAFKNDEHIGEIGDIYLYEHGMHMFYVTANVYDSDKPKKMLKKCHILDLADIRLSDLLTCIQNEIDPEKMNEELSANILKASELEGEHRLGHILTDCGIPVLKTSTYVHCINSMNYPVSGIMDYVFVDDSGDLCIAVIDSDGWPEIIELKPTNSSFTTILEGIKEAANIAWNNVSRR